MSKKKTVDGTNIEDIEHYRVDFTITITGTTRVLTPFAVDKKSVAEAIRKSVNKGMIPLLNNLGDPEEAQCEINMNVGTDPVPDNIEEIMEGLKENGKTLYASEELEADNPVQMTKIYKKGAEPKLVKSKIHTPGEKKKWLM